MHDIKTNRQPSSKSAPVRMLALPGSLRGDSFNRRLCTAAIELAPAHVELEMFDRLASIPLFNEDIEAATGSGPDSVRDLRDAVARADGLLIATPEYNQSIPGVLKNLVDWLSRPAPDEVLAAKPVAVIGASSGPWGTRLAQKELRHVLQATGSLVLAEPTLFMRDAAALFDAEGHLDDSPTCIKIATLLDAFATWIERVGKPGACTGNEGRQAMPRPAMLPSDASSNPACAAK